MTNVTIKLDHCVIQVSGWDRSNAFYRDLLGVGRSVYFRDPDGSLLEFISYADG